MSQVCLEQASSSHTNVAEPAFRQVTKESIDTFELTLYRKDENTSAAVSDADNFSEILESIKAEAPAAPYSKRLLMNGPAGFLEKGSVMMTRNPDLSLNVGLRCTDESALKNFEALKDVLEKGEFGDPCSVHLEVAIQERSASPSLASNRQQGENAISSLESAGSFEQSVSGSVQKNEQNPVGTVFQGAFESVAADVRSHAGDRSGTSLFSVQTGSAEPSVLRNVQIEQNPVGTVSQGAFAREGFDVRSQVGSQEVSGQRGSAEPSVLRNVQTEQNPVGTVSQGAFAREGFDVRSQVGSQPVSGQRGSAEQNPVGTVSQGAFVREGADVRSQSVSVQTGSVEQQTVENAMDGQMPSMAAVAESLLRQVPSEGRSVITGQEGSVLFEKASDGSLSVSLLCADTTKERAFAELADAIVKQCEKRGTTVSVSVQPEPKDFARELETMKKSSSSPSELLVNAFHTSFAFGGPTTVSAEQVTTPPDLPQSTLTTDKLEKLVQRILVAENGGTKEVRLTLGNSVLQGTDVVVSRSNDGMISVRLLCSDQASFQTALESRQNLVEMLSRGDRNVSVSVEQASAGGADEQGNYSQRRSQTYQEYTQDSDS